MHVSFRLLRLRWSVARYLSRASVGIRGRPSSEFVSYVMTPKLRVKAGSFRRREYVAELSRLERIGHPKRWCRRVHEDILAGWIDFWTVRGEYQSLVGSWI